VKEGYLVLSDPVSIKDISTFDDPNRPGTEVLVNDRAAVEKGKATGITAGRTIRRRIKRDAS